MTLVLHRISNQLLAEHLVQGIEIQNIDDEGAQTLRT